MSIKANALKSNEAQRVSLMNEINTILGQIDDELKLSHDQGKHYVHYLAPITFSIPYMSNTDAQRKIYSDILQSLLDRGFCVDIEMGKKKTQFNITWLSKTELDEIEIQNALIAKYSTQT